MVSTDTICALATPPGVAGLAVLRVSGPGAFEICDTLFKGSCAIVDAKSHTILYGWWGFNNVRVDSVTVSVYRSPHSYTGEDVVEIGCHGGIFTTEQILQSLLSSGSRLADPGEFTRRAFLNRKLDLTQVEAVADIIHAETRVGAQTAARQLSGGFTTRITELRKGLFDTIGLLELELDFSEEDVEFVNRDTLRGLIQSMTDEVDRLADSAHTANVLRTGYHVAVVGFPNAGKSSLFNALLERPRAIVSTIEGTTRDYLRETTIIDGYSIHLVDTAGLRDSTDQIELQGMQLTSSVMEESDCLLVINDASLGWEQSDSLVSDLHRAFPNTEIIVVQNKIDLVQKSPPVADYPYLLCSASSGFGIDTVRLSLVSRVKQAAQNPADILINARQTHLLRGIGAALRSALSGLDNKLSSEFLAVDLRSAIRLCGEITGETWSPDVLDTVFSRFCIGK